MADDYFSLRELTRRVLALEEAGLDIATDQALAADNANGDVFSGDEDISEKQALEAQLAQRDEELAVANERIAELESREPEVRIERVEVEVELDPPADGIPDEFRGLMLLDETAERFTERMKRRWQALQHYRIDGSKPTNSRALPDMTDEEKAEMADLEARNKTAKWLD